MPRTNASAIELSAKQEEILRSYTKSKTVGENLRSRSEIIILASEGKSNNAIEKEMGITGKKVTRWRNRYGEKAEEINRIEKEKPHKLRSIIKEILSDEQRAGAPPTYKEEKVAAIIALACEDPASRDLPFSHWSPGLLRKEAIKLGIVEDISVRQVGRFLKSARFKAASEPILAEP